LDRKKRKRQLGSPLGAELAVSHTRFEVFQSEFVVIEHERLNKQQA